ncbi:hypothetical protein FVB9288_00523 [Flavobacterium sp. CECT 9288]|uniref:glycosyltransferase family 2 protein n=1 Tax=Flavobacterium sp. CECT 9288 TaxID=2845819 RepID=UPI001E49DA48|nr:glycosyltransferase family A protein [Flavobacterium sp. CECT 9288]CAH0334908.1 hypothetical protein FVB9288_00523 [Flavobacterium sp. CECT 9288]
MIIVFHHKNKVTAVKQNQLQIIGFVGQAIAAVMVELARKNQEEIIAWCAQEYAEALNENEIASLLHHQKMMISYGTAQESYLGRKIGYVEESPFLDVKKNVLYPTWLMSSTVGAIHANVLFLIAHKIPTNDHLDFFLNSAAKIGMLNGLLCYSEPRLLKKNINKNNEVEANNFVLFRFVRQHYKKRWLLLLFLNLIVFEKQLAFFPLIIAFTYQSRKKIKLSFDTIAVQSRKEVLSNRSIDVIIPTIGRKAYLHDVLKDLALQTHLPNKVIIVEQNPQLASVSELDFLQVSNWPFQIKHIFTHQAGACNARNVALNEVRSEWVFLNDDDNRFGSNLIEAVFEKVEQYGTEACTTAYLQQDETQIFNTIHQSGIFGSGNSFVKASALQHIRFDAALEFGYGEDTDFGMQLRQSGVDIIYFPSLYITHLKAPMGGFRIKTQQKWDNDLVVPKPSPTVMYVFRKHYTREQLLCFKLVSFFKLLKKEPWRNWGSFIHQYERKWQSSLYWSKKL